MFALCCILIVNLTIMRISSTFDYYWFSEITKSIGKSYCITKRSSEATLDNFNEILQNDKFTSRINATKILATVNFESILRTTGTRIWKILAVDKYGIVKPWNLTWTVQQAFKCYS